MTRIQKLLLAWSAIALAAALALSRLPLTQEQAVLVGLAELGLAVLTGIAFGLSAHRDEY